MESTALFNLPPVHLSLLHQRRPFFSHSLKSPFKMQLLLKASFNPISFNPQINKSETPKPLFSLLKTTCVTIISAALFLSSFTKHSIAAPPPTPLVQSTDEETAEKLLEDRLTINPQDIDALRSLMEIKLNNQKLLEAIEIVDRLIQIEPSEKQWRLLRSHLHSYSGDIDSAKLGFEEILSEDPLFVEAYHGLAMTVSAQSDSGELENLYKRIENAVEMCKKEKRKEDLRDFRLLVAQLRFIEGDYVDALNCYQELVKEEPRDFRPYLYQGIIYTLLRQTNEAKKQFDIYKRLVPNDHPYARYFEDNIMTSEAFTEMIGNQKPGSMS
ncbi:hypothetical protein ACHQM5_010005 [Ranunculus cassubicifolius]